MSQKFQLWDHPSQMEPLLPGEQRLGELAERAHDLTRSADQLAGKCQPGALDGLRGLLRAMNSYYSNRIRRGKMQLLAVAASHHRLAWIHPFRDGNGRVVRLHTHLALGQMGLTNGLWSPLRGFARSHDAYYAHLAAADAPRAGDLDGRGKLSERALCEWIAYVLDQCLDQVRFMTGLMDLDRMKERIAACLSFEEQVVRQGVRTEALRALHYLFATQGTLERADFKAQLGLGERMATAQVSALLKRGLLLSDSPCGKLRFGVPQHALRFCFPGLWPEAERGS